MHPELIKAHLRMRGHSVTALAATLGVSDAAVHWVITGQRRSRRIAERVCTAAGLDLETAFPGRYPAGQFTRYVRHKEAA